MNGMKDLDKLFPRTAYNILEEAGQVIVEIDGARTVVIDGDVITQNGIELFARFDQEVDNITPIHKKMLERLLAKGQALGRPEKKDGTQGTVTLKVPVQEGRRSINIDKTEVTKLDYELGNRALLEKKAPGTPVDTIILEGGKEYATTTYDHKAWFLAQTGHKPGKNAEKIAALIKELRELDPNAVELSYRYKLEIK
jgi:hypothetical protein